MSQTLQHADWQTVTGKKPSFLIKRDICAAQGASTVESDSKADYFFHPYTPKSFEAMQRKAVLEPEMQEPA